MVTIGVSIADYLSKAGPEIEGRLIALLAEREIARRVDALSGAYAELGTLEKNIAKVKPDQTSFDAAGAVVSSTFSRMKLDELNKLRDRQAKVTRAFNAALGGDWGQLNSLGGTPAKGE